MTRKELAIKISNKTGMNLDDSDNAIMAMIDCIKQGLVTHDKITIKHFGVFKAMDKEERPGRNPKTGEAHIIAARRVVKFQASKTFKNELNGG